MSGPVLTSVNRKGLQILTIPTRSESFPEVIQDMHHTHISFAILKYFLYLSFVNFINITDLKDNETPG